MTFDEMVILTEQNGDRFRSLIRTEKGYQVNVQSHYDDKAYATAFGSTPTGALEGMLKQRGNLTPIIAEIEDLI